MILVFWLALLAAPVQAATYTFDCQGTASSSADGTHVVCAPGTTPVPPDPTPPAGLANCSNQGIYVLGGAAIPMTWQGSQTFFSTTYGNFGDSTAWLFTLAVPGDAQPTNYRRITVSEYGGNAYMRTVLISLVPCDMRTVIDITGVNGPVAASGGTTASVYYGAASSPLAYPYVMAPGKTYYVTIINHQWQDGWTCGKSNCQAIVNLQ